MDITQLILEDHHEQRRLFAILEQIDRADTASLASVWKRLSTFLEVHAETEERIFYPELLRVGRLAGKKGDVEDETLDAIKDHNESEMPWLRRRKCHLEATLGSTQSKP